MRELISQEREKDKRQEVQRTAEAQFAERQAAYRESEEKARSEHEDFDDMVHSIDDLDFSQAPVVLNAILTSDSRALLTYELAKDRELAEKIQTLGSSQSSVDQLEAVRLIARIEGRLAVQSITPHVSPKPKPPVVSKAPPPGTPIAARGSAPVRTVPQIEKEMAATSDQRQYDRLVKERATLLGKN